MESHYFLDNDVADSLYSGKFGGLTQVDTVPDIIKDWILQKYPGTTHIRIGPVCGIPPKMEWWIGGWINPIDENRYKPNWEDKIYSKWKQL